MGDDHTTQAISSYQGHLAPLAKTENMAIDYLQNWLEQKPFLLMYHFKATHDPWASLSPFDTLCSNVDMPEPAKLLDDHENKSAHVKRPTSKLERINRELIRTHVWKM